MTNVGTPPRIDSERLWRSLMTMAQIGATPRGGCNRQALTDQDKAARDLFVSWGREAGCSVVVDEIGNIFLRFAGSRPELAPVLIGSHLDTQATGGRFDGVYGVLAGLEVIRTLIEGGVAPLRRKMLPISSTTTLQPASRPQLTNRSRAALS